MALMLQVREEESGRWACSIGSVRFDSHESLGYAVDHMQGEAAHFPDSELWVHFGDGTSAEATATLT